MLVQYNSQQDLKVQTLWYGGTSTLSAGQAVVYDTDDTNAPVSDSWDPSVDPGPNSLSTTANRNLRGSRVVDVTSALTGGFAGLVAPSSGGVTGPAFIDVIIPQKGQVALAFCKVNATKNSTIVGIDTATPSNNLVSKTDATFNIDVVGIALETKDTSSTAGTMLIKFL